MSPKIWNILLAGMAGCVKLKMKLDGCPCGFVVGCDSGDMLEHLKDEHNIKAENEF